MVLFHALGRFLLVIINLVLVLISLSLITVGVLVKHGGDSLKAYTDPALKKIQESAQDAFGESDFTTENFDIGEVFGTVTSLLIGIGSVLLVISFLGSCGACCKVKCMLLLYAVILIVMVLAQIVFVVFLFGYTQVLKNAMKQPLKKLLKNFKGLNSTNAESVGWNFVMAEFQCCGLESYEDFKRGDSQWFGEGDDAWKTPVSCCKTLPKSNDFACAKANGNDTQYNNYNKGCVDEIWRVLIEENTRYTYLGVGSILAFQLLMIVFAFVMYCKDDENQVNPSNEDRPRRKKKRNNRSGW